MLPATVGEPRTMALLARTTTQVPTIQTAAIRWPQWDKMLLWGHVAQSLIVPMFRNDIVAQQLLHAENACFVIPGNPH